MGRISRVFLAISPFLPALSSIFVNGVAGPLAQWGLGGVALALLGFHGVNARTRVRLGHWGIRRLRGVLCSELLVGCGVPAAIAAVAFSAPTSWVTLFAIGCGFSFAHFAYEPIEERIREVVAAEGLRQGTSRFEERQPFRMFRIDDNVGEIAKREHGPGFQRFLAFWTKPPWRDGLSRTRVVILYAMLAACLVAFGGSIEIGIREFVAPAPPGPTTEAPEQKPAAPQQPGGSGPPLDRPPPAEPIAENDDEPCPLAPAYGAPTWARSRLNALYYGGIALNANPPPGKVGGCTGKAVVLRTRHGAFVYTVGRNDVGEIRSVAVYSLQFGAAIFLAPAAQRALALIRDGHAPLGGYPTVDVGSGDYTPVNTERGTYVLVRDEKHLPGMPDVAAPYLELPPPVASAWMGAMREVNSWLWPRAEMSGRGIEVLLSREPRGEAEFTIAYEPSAQIATRDGYRYSLPTPQLGQTELEELAASG